MYRCSVRELSVRNDGQSESEHANLTDVPLPSAALLPFRYTSLL